jgi:hypothetical protein
LQALPDLDPIGIAAHHFTNFALTLKRQHAGDYVIQKLTVMTHHQQRVVIHIRAGFAQGLPALPNQDRWSAHPALLVFFNPVPVADFVNGLAGQPWLPDTVSFMPYWIPLTLVWVCLGFMSMEAGLLRRL